MNVFKIFSPGKRQNLSQQDETELMSIIKNADDITKAEAEFGKLYDSLVNKLWGKLYKKFGTLLDLEDLEDAFQEGWRKVLENRKSYNEGSNVYNWIYTILKNTAFDISRKEKKIVSEVEIFSGANVNAEKDDGEEESLFSHLASEDKTIQEEIEANEVVMIINKAIEDIEDDVDRMLIQRRVLEGIKFSEIAKEFDIPIATVHYRVNQTLNKLKPKLKKLLDL